MNVGVFELLQQWFRHANVIFLSVKDVNSHCLLLSMLFKATFVEKVV